MRTLKDRLRSGKWRIRAENPDRSFKTIGTFDDETEADEVREHMRAIFAERGLRKDAHTVGSLLADFSRGRRAKDRGYIAMHLLADPIASTPLRSLARRDIKAWVRRMEAKRALVRAKGGGWTESDRPLSQKMAREMLCLLRLALARAVDDELIRENPARDVTIGDRKRPGRAKAFSFIYPSEDAALMACASVPFEDRILYGFLAREGMRKSEALRLTWADVDLERGIVRLDVNKTNDPRSWALDPGVASAIAWWKAQRKPKAGEAIFVTTKGKPRRSLRCDEFRERLRLAGVKRPELFESTAKRQAIRVHDLRASFVTLSLAAGKTERWVQDRTGHTTNAMLQGYHRAARTAVEVGLGPLSPLDVALGLRSDPRADPQGGSTGENHGRNDEVREMLTAVRIRLPRPDEGAESQAETGGRGSAVDHVAALLAAMQGDDDRAIEAACLAAAAAREVELRDTIDLIARVRAGGPDMVAATVALLDAWSADATSAERRGIAPRPATKRGGGAS